MYFSFFYIIFLSKYMKGFFMKKVFFLTLILLFCMEYSFGDCSCSKTKDLQNRKTNTCDKDYTQKCDKCIVDDDEYCIYNQCYFDKQFRLMKTRLCLNKQQECNIDSIYKKFKSDMEFLHARYTNQKNKVLTRIVCTKDDYKEYLCELKDIKKEMKDRLKCFKSDVKQQLCKSQYKAYRKFNRQEKRRIKRIAKYGAIYKFPCTDCKKQCEN